MVEPNPNVTKDTIIVAIEQPPAVFGSVASLVLPSDTIPSEHEFMLVDFPKSQDAQEIVAKWSGESNDERKPPAKPLGREMSRNSSISQPANTNKADQDGPNERPGAKLTTDLETDSDRSSSTSKEGGGNNQKDSGSTMAPASVNTGASLDLKDDEAEEMDDEFNRRCAKINMVDRNDGDEEDVATDSPGKYFGQDSMGLSVQSSRYEPAEPRQIPKATGPIGSFGGEFEEVVSVESMDVSSASSALMSMSLGSSKPNASTKSGSKGSSTNNPSTLSSSQDDSGLTAGSTKQARLRGGGLGTLMEDAAVHPGRIIQFGGLDRIQGTKKSSANDDSSAMSRMSWSVLSFGRDQDVSTEDVKDKEIADRNGRRGKYTGTCIVPRFRVGGRTLHTLPHGKGVMAYDSGMMYNGEWSKGSWEGHGKVDYSPNNYYAGSFVRGRFSGEGLRGFDDGSEYERGWKDGKRSGKGTFRNDKGDVFDGHWVNDKLKGEGRVRFADGSQYKGMFVGGVQKGRCTYIDRLGREHVGVWVSNRRFGFVHRYDGLWKKGQPDGFGRVRFASGDFYEGECDSTVHRFRPCAQVFACGKRVLGPRTERRIWDVRLAFWFRIRRRVEEERAEWKGQDEVARRSYVRG